MIIVALPLGLWPAVRVCGAQGGAYQAVHDLTIGRVNGPAEYVFARIVDLGVDHEGRILVIDGGDRAVKVFDPAGRHLRTFGRVGGGPGEFRAPAVIAVAGDTVAVYDTELKRLTVFAGDGTVIRTVRLAVPLLWPTGLAMTARGFLLGLEAGYSIPPRPGLEGRWWLLDLRLDGSVRDTVVAAPNADLLLVRTAGWLDGVPAPFRRQPTWTIAADERLIVGRGESTGIDVFRRHRADRFEPAERLSLPELDFTVTQEDIRRYRAAYRARYLDHARFPESRVRLYRDVLEDVRYPHTWPAYDRLRSDEQGRLWARRPAATRSDRGELWQVIGARGQSVAEVRVAESLDVRAIRGGCLYGIATDDLGVHYVKRYCVDSLR